MFDLRQFKLSRRKEFQEKDKPLPWTLPYALTVTGSD